MTGIDTDVKAVQKMFDVNVFGPMRMVRTFHPFLIGAQGTIVNIGSVGGIVPYVYGCASNSSHDCARIKTVENRPLILVLCAASYNATKAALHHWGNTLRVEMAPLGWGTPVIEHFLEADLLR